MNSSNDIGINILANKSSENTKDDYLSFDEILQPQINEME